MKNARLPLEHIRQAMRFLLEHVHAKEDMERDVVLRYAVERNFAVIGEAAKRVPESFRKEHALIPWKEMAGMRDMIIHEYDEIDIDAVWGTIEKDIPKALKDIDRLLETSV
ncbi:MAG: HepT-like ribonuclease domain-containing protein [Patescibacteria group bacterium]